MPGGPLTQGCWLNLASLLCSGGQEVGQEAQQSRQGLSTQAQFSAPRQGAGGERQRCMGGGPRSRSHHHLSGLRAPLAGWPPLISWHWVLQTLKHKPRTRPGRLAASDGPRRPCGHPATRRLPPAPSPLSSSPRPPRPALRRGPGPAWHRRSCLQRPKARCECGGGAGGWG